VNDNGARTPEQELAEKLASFDEALKRGDEGALEGSAEIRRAQECLRLLEKFWPRHTNNAPTVLKPVLAAAAAAASTPPTPAPATVGRFQIRRELGRGGFGIVYLAHDPQLHRDVALKVPRADVVHSAELRQRFQQEARAAAGLDHPNLVPVYEAGEDGSLCWIVSAYCPGVNLADWLRQRSEPVPFMEAAQLVLALAAGVHHAHQRGILHRDLKPANILLVSDGVTTGAGSNPTTAHHSPLATCQPKITDFGLAKLADVDLQTKTGAALGTPAYMAPEQAMRTGAAVGWAADVYSLGVILYELMASRPPFAGDSPLEIMLQARTDEPVAPSRLRRRLPRDLETICLKCLEKEPGRRYATAGALADDLQRFLKHEPIKARPIGATGRAARWARRRPAIAALIVVLVLTLAAGVAGVGWQWGRAEFNAIQFGHERDAAQAAQRKEAETFDRLRIVRAFDEWHADNAQAARDLLQDAAARKNTWEYRYVDRLCNLGLHQFADHQARICGVAFNPNGRKLISAGRNGVVLIRDLANGTTETVPILPDRPQEISAISLSPGEGRLLAVATTAGLIHLWDLRERKLTATWKAHEPGSLLVAFSPRGRYLATAMGTSVKIWDFNSGAVVHTFRQSGDILDMNWSSDERFLASCAFGARLVRVWDIGSGQETTIPTLLWMATALAFSPDGKYFAWAGMDGVVSLHDVSAKFQRVETLAGASGYQARVAFSPDGRLVLCGGLNGPVKMWRAETGQLVGTLHGHSSGVRFVAFSPDGSLLATAGADRRVIVWDMLDDQDVSSLIDFAPGRFRAAAFSPDGRKMVTAIRQFRRWDLDRLATTFTSPAAVGVSIACHPDGEQFAGGDEQGIVHVFDQAGAETAARKMSGFPLALKYVDAGRRLLVAGWNNSVVSWGMTGTEEPQVVLGPLGKADRRGFGVDNCLAAFSAEGDALAYVELGQAPDIWDLRSRQKRVTLVSAPRFITALTLDRTGERMALGSDSGEIQIRDAHTGEIVATLRGHPEMITGLAFTPDGSRLASAATDGVVKLWDPQAAVEVLSLRGHATFDTGLAFGTDGESLVAGGWNGYLRLWSLRDPHAETPETRLERRRAWHRWHADDGARSAHWFLARKHLDQLILLEPDRWEHRRRRGQALAELGEWDAAAVDFEAAMARADCPIMPFVERAVLLLRAGDDDGYRRLCRQVLERFEKANDFPTVNNLVWISLLPNKPALPSDKLLALAKRGVALAAPGPQQSTANSTFGCALCRAGRADEAIKCLNASVLTNGEGGYAEDRFFLAIAHLAQGRPDQAKSHADRAITDYKNALAATPLSDGRIANWRLRIELDSLHRELTSAMGTSAASK